MDFRYEASADGTELLMTVETTQAGSSVGSQATIPGPSAERCCEAVDNTLPFADQVVFPSEVGLQPASAVTIDAGENPWLRHGQSFLGENAQVRVRIT